MNLTSDQEVQKSLSETISGGACCCSYAFRLAAFDHVTGMWECPQKNAVYIILKTISKHQLDASIALGNFSLNAKVYMTLRPNLYVQVKETAACQRHSVMQTVHCSQYLDQYIQAQLGRSRGDPH